MRILFALLCLITGLALVFSGYRVARLLIPLWGFVTGLSLGGAVMADMANTPFLGTFVGVLVGLFAGLVLAIFAYLYYSAAVIILAGGLGYWVGSSLILSLGFSPGFISTMTGLALGVLAGVMAVLVNAPRYVLVLITAAAGAITTVGGVLLLFNTIPLANFGYAAVHATLSNSFWWLLSTIVLAVAGIVIQARTTSDYMLEEWAAGGHTPTTPTIKPTRV